MSSLYFDTDRDHEIYLGNKRFVLRANEFGSVTLKSFDRVKDNRALSTREAGMHCILQELGVRGHIHVHTIDHRSSQWRTSSIEDGNDHYRDFMMNTSRTGHWWQHADWDYGDAPELLTRPPQHCRLRVLIDQLDEPFPSYYILPERNYKALLRRVRDETLLKYGGTRPENPDSRHCYITSDQVAEWRDQWDLFDWNRA